ncbi:DgyrCDS9040 [Dimorphilus gyrociliatus]|uniref:DgyrCDS9040 n=1 Tax=Dimorphilus gyrociliatus TaxID=2664684 RepID=A0A7I8VVW9_9ANNE|nr:DgyrCDS9040 [Dimorphilus gyrociliatus]
MIRPLLILVNVLLIFIASSAVVLASYLAFTPSYITLYRAAEYEVDKNPSQKAQVNIIQVAVISMISLFFFVYVGAIVGLAGAITKDRVALGIYMVLLALLFVLKLVIVIYVAVSEPLNPFIPSIVEIYKRSFDPEDTDRNQGKVILWRKAIHKVQENFQCCAFKSITEYAAAVAPGDVSAAAPFPRSCCKTYDPDKNDFYDEDCYKQMITYIRHVNITKDPFRKANFPNLPPTSTFHNGTCLATVKSYLNKNKLFMILSFAILPFLLLIFLVCACVVCKKAKVPEEALNVTDSAIPVGASSINRTVSGMRMQRATKSKSGGILSRRDNDNFLEHEDFI